MTGRQPVAVVKATNPLGFPTKSSFTVPDCESEGPVAALALNSLPSAADFTKAGVRAVV